MMSRPNQKGFALVLTLTVMAFLIVLLVSLAALSKVETQISDNSIKQLQARQNALMALNIAIGQLQKYAGADARVTARSEATATTTRINPYITGVWNLDDPNVSAPSTPNVWLVSGSEVSGSDPTILINSLPDPSVDITSGATSSDSPIFLLGNNSVAAVPTSPSTEEKKLRIKLFKRSIQAPVDSMPGRDDSTPPIVGRYAWWIGDQGVKASIGMPDRAQEVTYPPWTTPGQRQRIRQQIGGTPTYFRATDAVTSYPKEGFDPLTAENATKLRNIVSHDQLRNLVSANGTIEGITRAHFHDFTTVASGVIANTRSDAYRGLMRDLSLAPLELGTAFQKYVNFTAYMESADAALNSTPLEKQAFPRILNVDSPRRRYLVKGRTLTENGDIPISFSVAPVLTDFFLQYRTERSGGSLVVKSRLFVSLWNPYTSAFVPPDELSLEISAGSPSNPEAFPVVLVSDPDSGDSVSFSLQATAPNAIKSGSSILVRLPFNTGDQTATRSWLPGRVYGWTTESGDTPTNSLRFHSRNVRVTGWNHSVGALGGSSDWLRVEIPQATLTVTLKIGTESVASYTATFPDDAINGPPPPIEDAEWKTAFAFAFRLTQPRSDQADRSWLTLFDPRSSELKQSDGALMAFEDSFSPTVYTGGDHTETTTSNRFLLGRSQGVLSATTGQPTPSKQSSSANNDVPLFELPRLPLLSIGELQHLQISGYRPFAVGNPWGLRPDGVNLNSVFDRFFFSGLPPSGADPAIFGVPNITQGQPLPNWNLKLDTADISSIRSDTTPAFSSRHILQGGAFNIHSVSAAAWRSILSSIRISSSEPFIRANIDNGQGGGNASLYIGSENPTTGTARETFEDVTMGSLGSGPMFFRYPQSAQETYYWENDPATPPYIRTQPFRRGIRGGYLTTNTITTTANNNTWKQLSADQIDALAWTITDLIRKKMIASGPFRSLEEFLSPQSMFGGKSLLEEAIANTKTKTGAVLSPPINGSEVTFQNTNLTGPGFSSLTLTQADIMTVLAPYLRTRSDTFLIRVYGESLNAVSEAVEARSWAEAVVQRTPNVGDGDDIIQPALRGVGRTFKIISFRWLSSTEI